MDIIVGLVFEWGFRIISWPFIAITRVLVLIFSLGTVNVMHKDVSSNSMVMVFSFVLFLVSIYLIFRLFVTS